MELISTTAQRRVEQYLAAASKSKTVIKPEFVEGETKSQYEWRLLRGSLKAATDILKRVDSQDIIITHGLTHVRKLNHPKPITDVMYNKNTKDYISLDGERIRIFELDGRLKSCFESKEPVSRLMYATHISLYVGWNSGSENLVLLNSSFVKQSVAAASGPILTTIYNENIGEIVVAGAGFLESWVFRYGGRCILPRKISRDRLSPDNDRFSIIAIEDSASRSQRAFLANNRSVAVFNLFTGSLLSYKHYLHNLSITALLFYDTLKYLITAAKDGTIKLWDENWNLQVVFVGHLGSIISMSVYPYGSKIMTIGDDQTLRTWSLETCDEVENIEVSMGTHSLGAVVNLDDVFSVAETHVDLWKFNHVHLLHTRVGEAVTKVTSTNHSEFPVRCVLDCVDSSVRIVSPTSGEVLTTLIMDPGRGLIASAYAIAEDTLFAAFTDGTIVKADTCVNPCAVMDEWRCRDIRMAPSCLVIYEFVVRVDSGADSYASAAKRSEISKGLPGGGAGRYKSRTQCSRTLLLGGLRNGNICVYNWDNGDIDLSTKAHDERGISSMTLNIPKDQLITTGRDDIIKVWRVYPYAQDTLALLMSLHVAGPPIRQTVSGNRLVAAFENSEMATYAVVMFNLKTKERYDHGPSDDHLQSITGLSSCPTMKLFASSSNDGTVRIWNNRNRLLRIVNLQCIAESISFCSPRADILLATGDHVHRIDYAKYLPRSYLLKMAASTFPDPVNEKPIPFGEDFIAQMSHNDAKRLKSARSAFRFTHFVDILTRDEAQELIREKKERQKVYSKLEARERELKMLRDGQFGVVGRSRSSPEVKQEAFDNYLKTFFDRPKIESLPEEPSLKDLVNEHDAEKHGDYVPEKDPFGFFPPPKRVRPTSSGARRKPDGRSLPPIDGFIPNSVLVRLLFPEKLEPTKEMEIVHPGLCLDDPERLERIRQVNEEALGSRSSSASLENRVQVLDYDEELADDADWELENGKASGGKQNLKSEDDGAKSKLANMLRRISAENTQVEELGYEDEGAVTYRSVERIPTVPDTRPTFESSDSDAKTEADYSWKMDDDDDDEGEKDAREFFGESLKIADLSSELDGLNVRMNVGDGVNDADGKNEQRRRNSSSSVVVPDYLSRFRGRDWFDRHFPASKLENLSKAWTLKHFVLMLSRLLRISDSSTRCDIIEALLELNRFHDVTNSSDVYDAVYAILADEKTSPCYENPADVAFVRAALKLMHALGKYDVNFYRELMVMYLDGDDKLKTMVMTSLEGNGLRDASRELPRELDSWDSWTIDGKDRNARLRSICGDWLTKWMAQFKNHIRDSAERLQKGHGVHGQVQLDQVKGLMSKKSPEHIVKTTAGSPGVIAVTVAHGNDIGTSAASKATYMDAINYFCEMAMHRQFLLKEKPSADEALLSSKKNTIVSHHRLCGKAPLVRIGDTHISHCHQKRETAYQVDFTLPAFNYINLPLKKIVMNPFPDLDDHCDPLDDQQPILLMLKTSQKYFIPARSFIAQQSS